MLQASDLLSFFLRPKVAQPLNGNLSMEIENIQESPGLFYAHFHNQNGTACLPANLTCVNLATSTPVQSFRDCLNRPVFLVVDTLWYAFCQDQSVLVYIHGCGVVLLPNKVVHYYLFSLHLIFDFS